uniref:ZM domain-containing protein n=1 Tax=Gongylonema pulchrum TaxID=637853 RepID=A0A183DFA2_9BILA
LAVSGEVVGLQPVNSRVTHPERLTAYQQLYTKQVTATTRTNTEPLTIDPSSFGRNMITINMRPSAEDNTKFNHQASSGATTIKSSFTAPIKHLNSTHLNNHTREFPEERVGPSPFLDEFGNALSALLPDRQYNNPNPYQSESPRERTSSSGAASFTRLNQNKPVADSIFSNLPIF